MRRDGRSERNRRNTGERVASLSCSIKMESEAVTRAASRSSRRMKNHRKIEGRSRRQKADKAKALRLVCLLLSAFCSSLRLSFHLRLKRVEALLQSFGAVTCVEGEEQREGRHQNRRDHDCPAMIFTRCEMGTPRRLSLVARRGHQTPLLVPLIVM